MVAFACHSPLRFPSHAWILPKGLFFAKPTTVPPFEEAKVSTLKQRAFRSDSNLAKRTGPPSTAMGTMQRYVNKLVAPRKVLPPALWSAGMRGEGKVFSRPG